MLAELGLGGWLERHRRQQIRSAVLERDLTSIEHGLDTLIGTCGLTLSGGQRQRAAAARTFVRQAELYVCDDLSSSLDAETEQQLWARAAGHGATFLVVSNRRGALARADQILLLGEGRLTAAGTLQELLQRSPEMRRLWSGEAAE